MYETRSVKVIPPGATASWKAKSPSYADGARHVAGPGAYVHAPSGSAHRFANESAASARMLVFFAPGGLDQMFLDLGTPVTHGDEPVSPMDEAQIKRLVETAPTYGVEIIPPEPA